MRRVPPGSELTHSRRTFLTTVSRSFPPATGELREDIPAGCDRPDRPVRSITRLCESPQSTRLARRLVLASPPLAHAHPARPSTCAVQKIGLVVYPTKSHDEEQAKLAACRTTRMPVTMMALATRMAPATRTAST